MTTQVAPASGRWKPWCLQIPLPLLIFAIPVWGAYSTRDEWEFGFEWVAIPAILALVAIFIVTLAMIVLTSRGGTRTFHIALHVALVAVALAVASYAGAKTGRWLWDRTVLGPQREAILDFSRHPQSNADGSVTIAGYRFPRVEATPQGVMLYALLRGPFPDEGVFVPTSEGYRGFSWPDEGEPRKASSVTPTSVRGLYWFVTRD